MFFNSLWHKNIERHTAHTIVSWPNLKQWVIVTPYGVGDIGQHWFMEWLIAWQHQAITWTNVDLPSTRSSGIHYTATATWILKILTWWWRHQMETFPRYWPFVRGIHRSPVNSPHKGHWRGALVFSLIFAWINGWVNSREAGDLRRYRTHYGVTVMMHAVSEMCAIRMIIIPMTTMTTLITLPAKQFVSQFLILLVWYACIQGIQLYHSAF